MSKSRVIFAAKLTIVIFNPMNSKSTNFAHRANVDRYHLSGHRSHESRYFNSRSGRRGCSQLSPRSNCSRDSMYLGAATRNKNINPSRSTTKSRDDDVHSRMHSIHAYDEIKVKTDTQIWFVNIFYLYTIY